MAIAVDSLGYEASPEGFPNAYVVASGIDARYDRERVWRICLELVARPPEAE